MSAARINDRGDDRIAITGDLDFATVPGVAGDLLARIGPGSNLAVSLEGVTRANSAGLVLILEALSAAHAAGSRITFEDLPASLVHLADLCNVDGLLDG